MSAVFLGTEIGDAWREEIVSTLRSSGYSEAELDSILWAELCPVLYGNLLSMAGEWQGFNMGYVEQQIIAKPAGHLRQWWAYINGGNMARHKWHRIKQAMAARRAT